MGDERQFTFHILSRAIGLEVRGEFSKALVQLSIWKLPTDREGEKVWLSGLPNGTKVLSSHSTEDGAVAELRRLAGC